MQIILASQSPRRRELLSMVRIPFTVEVSGEKERIPLHAAPQEVVMSLARQKAEHVFKNHPDACVIGSDTIVVLGEEILGKPANPAEAAAYLRRLQGRSHRVYTGLSLLTPQGEKQGFDMAEVHFAPMSEEEIAWYVSTGDPMDKAGAYGIQGDACCFVRGITGNYFTVMGLPLPLLYRYLRELGILDEQRKLL